VAAGRVIVDATPAAAPISGEGLASLLGEAALDAVSERDSERDSRADAVDTKTIGETEVEPELTLDSEKEADEVPISLLEGNELGDDKLVQPTDMVPVGVIVGVGEALSLIETLGVSLAVGLRLPVALGVTAPLLLGVWLELGVGELLLLGV
jgi:hypothetical protein